ncbi:cupin domain-containing protein [Yinghuangia sp. YIM S09857]|uniref:cupin domain-containing protein n=1 Tax=Yinghuangia sp. YIM S09857 TaxID=3436929 RepID=UPI003F5372A9
MAAEEIIRRYDLAPHPEGGFFRRIYTSPHTVALPYGERPTATSIYYLLTAGEPISRLHRNRSDILHHLIDGGPVDYVTLDDRGELTRTRLAPDGERSLVVPGGVWKASSLPPDVDYALVAELVTPGFSFDDHEFAPEALLAEHPGHAATLTPYVLWHV